MRSDIAPGATFPDYELPDQEIASRKLSEIQGNDPLILTLARGNYYWFWGRPSFVDLWHDLRTVSTEIRRDWELSKPGLRESVGRRRLFAISRMEQALAPVGADVI